MKTLSLDQRINQIRPGGTLVIGECNGIRVVAEVSGDGRTLRFVRETRDGFVVFRTINPHRPRRVKSA